MAYCGDDAAAKKIAATLIRDVGFDPVDSGPLRIARYLEPFTLLMGQLAYEGREGPQIAYRFDVLGTAVPTGMKHVSSGDNSVLVVGRILVYNEQQP